MQVWQDILKAALLGAGRETVDVATLPGAVGETVRGACEQADAPTALLRAAAIVGTARLAGVVAASSQAMVSPAPAETMPVCSAGAMAYLSRMLGGEYQEAMAEFLEALAGRGKRVGHACLPELLTAAAANRGIQPVVRKVMGERGAWLMRQNTAWQFDTLEDDQAAWDTGTREVRIAAFARMRASDPDGALGRLAAVWPKETPEDRAALVACLSAGLSMADEPFLEAALDDRRKEVRKAAADLLLRLGESRLVARMLERLRRVLGITVAEKRKLLGLGSAQRVVMLEVKLPEACDKAMLRDGMESKPSRGGGEKAWWVEQMVAAVPLAMAQELEGIAPESLVEAAGKTDFAESLLRGWALSASRHGNEPMVRVLLAWQIGLTEREQDREIIERLLASLPEPVRDAAAIAAIADREQTLTGGGGRAILLACPRWSASLSRAVLRQIINLDRDDGSMAYAFREVAVPYALRMDASLAAEVAAMVEKANFNGYLAKSIEAFASMVQFRHDMLKETGR